MLKKDKKLILLENKDQALKYLKNRDKFKDFVPISFSFPTERLLEQKNIKFKKEEDYEKNSLYNGICRSSIKSLEKILKTQKIRYKDIELLSLLYYDLCLILSTSKKYLRLLKEILKKENPKEIIIFKASKKSSDGEFIPTILKYIFGGEIKSLKYSSPKKKDIIEKTIFRIIGFLQKAFALFSLKTMGKGKKKIFIYGGKFYFKSIIKLLLKNKKNKIFKFSDQLRKSFFVDLRYIPFYEFSGKKDSEQEKLKENLKKFLERLDEINFSKEFEIEEELAESIKEKIIELSKSRFLKVSGGINEMISLFKQEKIDLVLLCEDDTEFTKAIARVANLFNVPSIVSLHGVPGKNMSFGPLESDYFIVFGKRFKDWAINNKLKNKREQKKIKVFGCPRYDSFEKKKKKGDKKIILYAMEVCPETRIIPDYNLTKKKQKDALRILFRVLKKFPEYKLVIKLKKLRPKWDMVELPSIIAKQENFENFEIIERADNIKLINNSNIMIINRTTMGIEALLLDKPVISISFKDLDKNNPYKNLNAVDIVYTEKELENAIRKKRGASKKKIFFEDYILSDRNASKRSVDFINKILEER